MTATQQLRELIRSTREHLKEVYTDDERIFVTERGFNHFRKEVPVKASKPKVEPIKVVQTVKSKRVPPKSGSKIESPKPTVEAPSISSFSHDENFVTKKSKPKPKLEKEKKSQDSRDFAPFPKLIQEIYPSMSLVSETPFNPYYQVDKWQDCQYALVSRKGMPSDEILFLENLAHAINYEMGAAMIVPQGLINEEDKLKGIISTEDSEVNASKEIPLIAVPSFSKIMSESLAKKALWERLWAL